MLISRRVSSEVTHLAGFVDRHPRRRWWLVHILLIVIGVAVAIVGDGCSSMVAVHRVLWLGFGFGSWDGLDPFGSCFFWLFMLFIVLIWVF